MSIFSKKTIVEDPWVGMVYEFFDCTHPDFKGATWNSALSINFSSQTIKELLNNNIRRSDGSIKLDKDELTRINKRFLMFHMAVNAKDIYRDIILLCLINTTLSEKSLSDLYTACLNRKKKDEGDVVTVEIDDTIEDFVIVRLHVHTTTPQMIRISLMKK